MSAPVASVIVPCRNVATTVEAAVAGVLASPLRELEVIAVDDGSSDGTEKMVREWQKQDNGFEIRYIYKENGGMHTAHNTAYEAIDTELNVCIDSDDRLDPDSLKALVNRLKAHTTPEDQVDLIVNDYVYDRYGH